MDPLNNNINGNFNNRFGNPNQINQDQAANIDGRFRPQRMPNRRERSQIRGQYNYYRFKRTLRFLGAWNLNVVLMVVNALMFAGYTFIMHHHHFKEQQFNLDSILDQDKFPQAYLWGIAFMICHFQYIILKKLENVFLEWKPVQLNAQQQDQNLQHQQSGYLNNCSTLEFLFQENYYFHLFMIYIMDKNAIFATFFESIIFLMVYTIQSLIIAGEQLIFQYNKDIIETQISFSSSLLLRKNEIFQTRIKKLENYYICLLAMSLTTTLFFGWLFYYADLLLVSLLVFPGLRNSLKFVQDILNFKYQVNHALSFITNDDQIIAKMNFNFFFNFMIKFFDLLYCGLAFYIGGFSISIIPMVHIFLSQQFYKLLISFYQEIDKYRKFRSFLRNINNDYPLVVFQRNHENDECAICKEVMRTARKLPCNHCFHWFCIIQLIESGSKNCPICRAEFNNNRHNHLNPSNNNNNNNRIGNIFSFRLGGWLPNISVRMVRQRGPPAIPYPVAVERIREIFPNLTEPQITQELRQAHNHIDQAIINITENIQRGIYPRFN